MPDVRSLGAVMRARHCRAAQSALALIGIAPANGRALFSISEIAQNMLLFKMSKSVDVGGILVMAFPKPGESSKQVLDLQKKINAVRGTTVVKPTGAFDQETQDALLRLQKDLKVKATGIPDAKTMEWIEFNLIPRKKVVLWGTEYFLSDAELEQGKSIAVDIAIGQLEGYAKIMEEAWIYYDSLKAWREDSVVAKAVEAYHNATFPSAGLMKKADSTVDAMIRDAMSFKQFDVHARAKPIRDALTQVSDYRNKVQNGTAQLANALDGVAAVATVGLAFIGALGAAAPLATGIIVVAGSAGSAAFVTSMRSETKTHNFSGAIPKSVQKAAAAAVEAAILHYIMKGPWGFAKFMDKVAASAIKKFASGGFGDAVKTYIINNAKDSFTALVGEAIKIMGKAIADPGYKVSDQEVEDAMVAAVIKVLVLKPVSMAGEKFFTSASKQFDGSEIFKGTNMKADEIAKAYAGGVSAVVDKAGAEATKKELAKLKPGQVGKLEKSIRTAVLNDPKVKKAVREAAKKAKK